MTASGEEAPHGWAGPDLVGLLRAGFGAVAARGGMAGREALLSDEDVARYVGDRVMLMLSAYADVCSHRDAREAVVAEDGAFSPEIRSRLVERLPHREEDVEAMLAATLRDLPGLLRTRRGFRAARVSVERDGSRIVLRAEPLPPPPEERERDVVVSDFP